MTEVGGARLDSVISCQASGTYEIKTQSFKVFLLSMSAARPSVCFNSRILYCTIRSTLPIRTLPCYTLLRPVTVPDSEREYYFENTQTHKSPNSARFYTTMSGTDKKSSEKKSYHQKATGNALNTVKNHSKENDLKLYGSCFW